jgi:hypothetical protein
VPAACLDANGVKAVSCAFPGLTPDGSSCQRPSSSCCWLPGAGFS